MPWNTPGSHIHIENLLRVPKVDPLSVYSMLNIQYSLKMCQQ